MSYRKKSKLLFLKPPITNVLINATSAVELDWNIEQKVYDVKAHNDCNGLFALDFDSRSNIKNFFSRKKRKTK